MEEERILKQLVIDQSSVSAPIPLAALNSSPSQTHESDLEDSSPPTSLHSFTYNPIANRLILFTQYRPTSLQQTQFFIE